MKKRLQKQLCLVLSITILLCAFPQQAFAMDDLWDEQLAEDLNKINDAVDTVEKNSVTLHEVSGQIANLDLRLTGKLNKTIKGINAVNSLGTLMAGMQFVSLAMGVANGIMSILQMTGVIEDPTQKTLETILEIVQDIKEAVEEINQKVTQIQATLNTEFSNLEYKEDIAYAQQLQKNWTDFIRNEYREMEKLLSDYEERTNHAGIAWAKTWKENSKTDLRSLYNESGVLLYSGENFNGYTSPLPTSPAASDDTKTDVFNTSVMYEIVVPADYLIIDGKATINADNYVDVIRNAVLTAVKNAVNDGAVNFEDGILAVWSEKHSKDDIIAKIADDMVNSVFYEIGSQIANSVVDGTSFANTVLSAYKAFCASLLRTDANVPTVLESMLESLKLTYAFEGEAKDIANSYYALAGVSIVQYGALTSALIAMTPSIKSSVKADLAELEYKVLKYTNDTIDGFLTGNDNYCYPLKGVLSYVDVEAQYIVKAYEANNSKDTDVSDYAIVDASVDFDTDNMAAYEFEAKRNEATLKASMVDARNLAYLYHYMSALSTGKDIMEYLKDNGVVSGDGEHSTTLVTSEYEVKDHKKNSETLVSFPFGYSSADDVSKPVKGYEEGKYVKPLGDYTEGPNSSTAANVIIKTAVHDKLVGKTFSISGAATLSNGNTSATASREKAEDTLAIRVVQSPLLPPYGACYIFHDEANVTVSVTEDALENGSQAAIRSVFTVKAGKAYGALTINYDADDDSYSYDEVIRDKDGFVKFLKNIANGKTYEGKHVMLESDIDMAGVSLESYWSNDQMKKEFKGHFNGNNKTIKNITLDSSDHRVGLFRTTGTGALIENLKLENVSIGNNTNKNACAALVAYTNGDLTARNIEIVSGTIKGEKYVGGIVGDANEDAKITLLNCTNNATITSSDTDAGGMLGNVGEFFINGCVNKGNVTAGKGGAGGMVGYTNKPTAVKNSKNTGDITGYDCAGGMCGRIESDSRFSRFTDNENTGDIKATTKGSAGGIVGFTNGGGAYIDNKNSGDIVCTATEKTHCAGGILGGNEDDPILFKNNTNSGSVTSGERAGGIAGYLGDKDHDKVVVAVNNTNSGTITATGKDAGGIVGCLATDNLNHIVSNNTNTGSVTGKACTGGIVGWMAGGGTFEANTNKANILSQENDAGGIVGTIEDDKCTFKNSVVEGTTAVGNKTASGLVIRAENTSKHAGKICGWDGKSKASVNSDTLLGSIFGQGSILTIVIMAAVIIAAVVVIILVNKKKKNAAAVSTN